MLARVLAEPDASYLQAAELLGKIGDDDAREKGGAALVARAQIGKVRRPRTEERGPRVDLKALGALAVRRP